jgi:CubicO group peptidase (beta-lactamase class C family)
MKLTKTACAVLALATVMMAFALSCSESPTGTGGDADELEYVTPEEVGYSSEALADVEEAAEQSGYAAMMALHDGKVFFSYGDVARNYWCHSIRKPFLCALYGVHVEEGHIDLDDTVEDLGIDDIPPALTEAEKQAVVRDLLKSRSGIYHEAASEDQHMIDTRPERGSHAPGTFYYYNNWDFNALGTIFEQETGTKIFEEFKRKIADPIGMQDFSVASCSYQYELGKSMHPAYHFRMSARDMARFGVLYQQGGMWKGQEILPESWIEESTTAYSTIDEASGLSYGYMWRVFPEGSILAEMIGASGFYHTGTGVHALVVIPEYDLVVVQRYDTDGEWEDPGDVGLQIGIMIANARIER